MTPFDFADDTPSLLEDKNPANRFLRNPVFKWRTADDGSILATFRQFDPSSSDGPTEYNGHILGKSTITRDSSLTPVHLEILNGVGLTLLECNLDYPLHPQDSRWLRWSLRIPAASTNPRTRFGYFLDWLLNQLMHEYTICGPTDVNLSLQQKLWGFMETALSSGRQDERELALAAQVLLRQIHEGVQASPVKINDWQIHIFPAFFRRLFDIEYGGNLTVPSPARLEFPPGASDKERCYHCRSGTRCTSSGQQPGSFYLTFKARHPGRLIRLLITLGSIAGLVALGALFWP